jgi:hypothetical protein
LDTAAGTVRRLELDEERPTEESLSFPRGEGVSLEVELGSVAEFRVIADGDDSAAADDERAASEVWLGGGAAVVFVEKAVDSAEEGGE